MKNLHRKKKQLTARLVIAFVIALLQLPVIFGVRALFPDFFNREPKLITVCIILAFTLAALILLVKTMNLFAVAEAMIKNEKRLKTDRKFWKSKNKNVSVSSVRDAFVRGGFSATENDDGSVCLTKSGTFRQSFTVYDNAASPEETVKEKTSACMRVSSRYDKRAIALIFLVDGITDKYKKLSADASAIENGCVLPVFYDKTTDLAYYMGGDTGAGTPERPLQESLKKYLLGVDGDFEPKTESDKTDEELEFEKLDADEIFATLKKRKKGDAE